MGLADKLMDFVDSTQGREEEDDTLETGGGDGHFQVVLVMPDSLEDAAGIAEHIVAYHIVVLNLSRASNEVANRLLHFLSGVTYAKQGKIEKAANETYVITPYTVTLEDD